LFIFITQAADIHKY